MVKGTVEAGIEIRFEYLAILPKIFPFILRFSVIINRTGEQGVGRIREVESRMIVKEEREMTVERALRAIAGTFVLASVLLATLHSPYWLLFTGFVGLNLLQSGFTNWCPMVWILERVGLRREGTQREAHSTS